MEKTKHTPTPWKEEDGYYMRRIVGADGNPVVDILRRGEFFGEEEYENRRIIIAAVNDCDRLKIENAALHSAFEGLKKCLGTDSDALNLYAENQTLRAENARLLEALKGVLEVANVRIDDPRIAKFDAARAAVAEAEK